MDALVAITAAIELVKTLKDAKLSDAKVKDQMAELYLKLADLKMDMANLINENLDLKRKLTEALEKNNQKEDVFFDGKFYYKKNANGNEGPFCTGCYDNKKQLVRVTPLPSDFADLASHTCPVCKATY
jgi:hypothetical protein